MRKVGNAGLGSFRKATVGQGTLHLSFKAEACNYKLPRNSYSLYSSHWSDQTSGCPGRGVSDLWNHLDKIWSGLKRLDVPVHLFIQHRRPDQRSYAARSLCVCPTRCSRVPHMWQRIASVRPQALHRRSQLGHEAR